MRKSRELVPPAFPGRQFWEDTMRKSKTTGMTPREVWDEIERSFFPDNVPRRDEGLTDEERDEMDELRCKMVALAMTLPPEKLEELIIRARYVIDGHNDLPETLKSKFRSDLPE
jgi:hypothetical protein